MEGQTWLLLALACSSLFGAVFAQSECSPLPDASMIENRLQSTVRSQGGEGTNSNNVTLLQYHFTCIAVGSKVGTARELSVAVRYNVTAPGQPEVQRISQLLLQCSGSNFNSPSQSTPFEPNQNETLFNLATRRDCRTCAVSGSPTIDNDTNCAVCDAMCAGGQGGCVTSFTDCCQFYDIVTRMCIPTCAVESRNTTDFTCDPCLSSPCQNQGMCNATSASNFTCNCTASFTGTNCETCSLSCENGGTPNSECAACMCPPGYTGTNCSMDIDDCASNPCGANGNCTDGFRSFTCNCTSPYTGMTCDSCMLQNCVRCENAVCLECDRGLTWNGSVCVDACSTNPCRNGGTCKVTNDGYMCECARNRTGTNCTMCASGFILVDSKECVRCNDTRCLTCSLGVNICTVCMDGFQVDDNTKQCVTGEGPPIGVIIGAILAVLALLAIIAIIVTVVIVAVWRKKLHEKDVKLNDFNKPGAKVTENLLYVSEKEVVAQSDLVE